MLLSRSFKVVVPLNPGKPTSNYTTCKNTSFVCMQVEFIHKLWNTCHRIFWIPELHKVKQNLENQLKKKIFKDYCTKKAGCFPGCQSTGGWEAIGEEISLCICPVPMFSPSATDHCQKQDKGVNGSLI